MVYAVLAFLFFRYETFHIWQYGPYFRRSPNKCDVSSKNPNLVGIVVGMVLAFRRSSFVHGNLI